MADKVREQIASGRAGRARRTDAELGRVFEVHAEGAEGTRRLPRARLHAALRVFHTVVSEADVDQFLLMRGGGDGSLDLEDFREAARTAWPVETWARSLPLAQLLADALPESLDCPRLRVASSLTGGEIRDIAEGVGKALRELLTEHVQSLRSSYHAMDQKIAEAECLRTAGNGGRLAEPGSKFSADITKMECGGVKDFHRGLEKRVGSCHLDFLKGMELEHCNRVGCDKVIRTSNYGLTTTPNREWLLVLGKEKATAEDLMFRRRIPNCDKLGDLHIAKDAGLTKAEIIALVLYTGPMFQVYNTALRQTPKAVFEGLGDNHFATTIHVLVSAVQKLSRSSRLPEGLLLFRGLGGTVGLPQSFFRSDANGCKGFTEWGFMSTTSERNVAIVYSGVTDKKPLPMVLQMRVRSIDRGACIRDFSQYPSEKEYLFVPCSFVEQDGPHFLEVTEEGVVTIIPVRVNANLKTMTVEELLGQKKALHDAAFCYLLDELQLNLREMAVAKNAEARLKKDAEKSQAGGHDVDSFINQILSQCKEVYLKHAELNASEYIKDDVFRRLVFEMVAVRAMAMSKLEEWLENESGSFMNYRFFATLKTVHRRRLLFLEHTAIDLSGEDKVNAFIKLCKARNLFFNNVDERNNQDETPLMVAAAEGRSSKDLISLVNAKADVKAYRNVDGVCAVWLAAQFGHVRCIATLVELNADPNQAAKNGATPAYIAAQGGNGDCVDELVRLKADLSLQDKDGLDASHQAAMNGHCSVISLLMQLKVPLDKCSHKGHSPLELARVHKQERCVKLLESFVVDAKIQMNSLITSAISETMSVKGNLIISSGDLTNIDRIFALVEYAKTGADVLFVMNYPAYIGVKDTVANFSVANPGLGYYYSAADLMKCSPEPAPPEYSKFLAAYGTQLVDGDVNVMKRVLTDIAFETVRRVWAEGGERRGRLLFCIGGVNSINPFSSTAIRNEILVYSKLFPPSTVLPSTEEGRIFDEAGKAYDLEPHKYNGVILDFVGSMAYFNDDWLSLLTDPDKQAKILGAFIAGGVRTDMPLVAEAGQNRFSSATVNQLYHLEHTRKFLDFISSYRVPTYVVTHSTVADFIIDGGEHGLDQFLPSNHMGGAFLRSVAGAYRGASDSPLPLWPGYHTAVALRTHLDWLGDKAAKSMESGVRSTLFFHQAHGMTLVSSCAGWEGALSTYVGSMDTTPLDEDSPQARAKKDSFRREHAMLARSNVVLSIPVCDVRFRRHGSSDSGQFLVELGWPVDNGGQVL